MSNNEIYNSSIESSKKELDNNKNLSKRDREKFADEFKSINSLIEEYLDIDDETPPATTDAAAAATLGGGDAAAATIGGGDVFHFICNFYILNIVIWFKQQSNLLFYMRWPTILPNLSTRVIS